MANTTKEYDKIFIKKNAAGDREYIKVPYAILADPPDLSVYAKLAGGNTFSGVQTVNAPANISGSEQATAKYKTANGGSITLGKEGGNSGTMIRLDQNDGTCRLRFRSSSTAGAMVWEQPEKGAQLFIDLGKNGVDYRRITMPSSSGTLALASQIPSAVTESTVSGWGFTKNKGTVTSVAVKMNNATKGTVTSSGTIDLGTVITAHQSIKSINTNHTTAQTVDASEVIAGSGTINLHKIAKTGSYNDLNDKYINYIGNAFVDLDSFVTDDIVTIDPSLFYPTPNDGDMAFVPATLNGTNPSIVCCSRADGDQWFVVGVSYAFPSSGGGATLHKYKVLGSATSNLNEFATLLYEIVTTAKSYRVYDQAQAGNRQIAVGYTVAVPDMSSVSSHGAIITLYQQQTIGITKFMSLIYDTVTHAATFSGTKREYTIGANRAVTATDATLTAREVQYMVIEYWNDTQITA